MNLTLLIEKQLIEIDIQKNNPNNCYVVAQANTTSSIEILHLTDQRIVLSIDNRPFECYFEKSPQGHLGELRTHYRGTSYSSVRLHGSRANFEATLQGGSKSQKSGQIRSIMPGKIVETMVKLGQQVTPDQTLMVMEAMKMENEIKATHSGVVKEIHVQAGQSVESDALLMQLEPAL